MILNRIDGERVPATSGQTLDDVEPATDTVWTTIPDSDGADVDAAVAAAKSAQPAWAARTVAERCDVLDAVADLLEARLPELASLESKDTGKPISLTTATDIPVSYTHLTLPTKRIV